MRKQSALATVVAMLALGPAATAVAAPSAATIQDSAASLEGIAVGVELGEPTSVTVRYAMPGGKLAGQLAVGTGTAAGLGLQLRVDLTYAPVTVMKRASSQLVLYVGLGARRYGHGFDPASTDEIDDTHLGVRAVIGASHQLLRSGMEFYGEAGLGYDVSRSQSCSLASGVNSICPHANSSRTFGQAAVGMRYYFGG